MGAPWVPDDARFENAGGDGGGRDQGDERDSDSVREQRDAPRADGGDDDARGDTAPACDENCGDADRSDESGDDGRQFDDDVPVDDRLRCRGMNGDARIGLMPPRGRRQHAVAEGEGGRADEDQFAAETFCQRRVAKQIGGADDRDCTRARRQLQRIDDVEREQQRHSDAGRDRNQQRRTRAEHRAMVAAQLLSDRTSCARNSFPSGDRGIDPTRCTWRILSNGCMRSLKSSTNDGSVTVAR